MNAESTDKKLKTNKTLSYLKGNTDEFQDEKKEQVQEDSRTKQLLKSLKDGGVPAAKRKLDDILGEGVERLAKYGETAGNVGAAGATAISTATEMLVPDSAGEAALAAVPGGRILSKLKKPTKKALKAGGEAAEAVLDYTGNALKPTSTKTGATKGWRSPKNTGIADTDKFIKQQAEVVNGLPDSVWNNWDITAEHAAKIKQAVMQDPTLLYKAQDANSGQINLSRLSNLIK